jgi:site-specific recombinase XerD
MASRANSNRYSINKNKYLLEPELDHLKQLIRAHMDRDTRNCLLLSLALRTGARAQEILNIKRSDLNPHDKSVYIRGLKGSNDRELPVEDRFFHRLIHFADQNSKNELVFPISYIRLYQIWDFYRPVEKKFHCLRHTFAIELYKKSRDIRLLQVALGHRNIANTMVYADYVFSQQELRKLIL